jgi:hypothetical protein
MSDFLSHLVDRALALPPLVRPRLQSIYEPALSSVGSNPLEEHFEVPAESSRVTQSAPEPALQPRAGKAGSRESGEGMDHELAPIRKTNPTPPTAAEQPVHSERVPPSPSPLPDEREPTLKIKKAEPQTPEHSIAHRPERQPDPPGDEQAGRSATPRERKKEIPADRSPETGLETPPPGRQRKSTGPQTFPPESTPFQNKPAKQPTVVTVQPAHRFREDRLQPTLAPAAAPREAAPPAAVPSVHVTIGRVEIRAVMPPAPEPRPAPAPSGSRLSLDEYLKRVNGGSR